MVVNVHVRPLKRTKRRVTADLYDFLTFPAPADTVAESFDGPFQENLRSFVQRFARAAPPSPAHAEVLSVAEPHLLTWRVAFRVGDEAAAAVEMLVVEEYVPRSKSVYCDHCRVAGWSAHPVCVKRYHFIIRNDNNASSACQHGCFQCGSPLQSSDLRCSICNYEMTMDDFEALAYRKLEDPNHLLHAVVHKNGYGHLVRVNGREGGSKFLTGSQIMSFWDRLCKMLRVRKITVMDVSKKYGMEYRVLHAVITGHPWYGDWGYEFGAGSFGLTADAYQKAVDMLSSIPLSLFFTHNRSSLSALQNIITFYWSLSNHQLITVRDLFGYVMSLLRNAHGRANCGDCTNESKSYAQPNSGSLCTWAREDVERAEEAMMRVLNAVGSSKWVSSRALRGTASLAVKSPEILDFCIKGLEGKRTSDGSIVVLRYNADTKATEYRLEADLTQTSIPKRPSRPSAAHLIRDLRFLYDSLLNPMTMELYKPKARRAMACSSARKLMDSKQFIKHYEGASSLWVSSNPFALHVWCYIEPTDYENDDIATPPELVMLPLTATVGDLKCATAKAFQETYLIFQRFHPEKLLDFGEVADNTAVKLLIGLNGKVRIKGRCCDERKLWRFRMERGPENWTVDCSCGAKDDDGERMLACDACGVWQHTRCVGIDDFDEVPAEYVCTECCSNLRSVSRAGREYTVSAQGVGRCNDESESVITDVGRSEPVW